MLKKLLLSGFLVMTSLVMGPSANAMDTDANSCIKLSGRAIKQLLESNEVTTANGTFQVRESSGVYDSILAIPSKKNKQTLPEYLIHFKDDSLYPGTKNEDNSYTFKIVEVKGIPQGWGWTEDGRVPRERIIKMKFVPERTLFEFTIAPKKLDQ